MNMAIILSKIAQFLLPLSLFIWALFMPDVAGYSYIGIYILLAGYLFFLDKIRPNPDPSKYTKKEIDVIRKYHLALRFPFASKDMSLYLNGFRFAGMLWVFLFLFNQMWIESIFVVVAYFLTASISLRLDPFFILPALIQKEQERHIKNFVSCSPNQVAMQNIFMFKDELSILKNVSEKFRNIGDGPKSTIK